ncbi:hypothetical protein L3X38_044376 [Prunus dulcis]|uniref:Uncharacterized protein n=1 Tax=Prunus dulcis TaxID=3755 RepID=A0AAD4UYI3_PRUDU|nr:hypothetical protein L3X38_044376 [Prunus dulcis]
MAFHTRSNSFPSSPHPVIQEIDENLCRLWSSEATSTSSSSISHKLSGLQNLHDCVDSAAKNALLQTKECVQDLQSIMLRTRRGERGALTTEVRKYLTSRKMVKKAIHKAMGNVKGSSFSSLNKDNETIAIVSTLRDVEAVTFTAFESHLSFISGPKSQPSSWSLVSKMMQSKKVDCVEESEANEFVKVDGGQLLNFSFRLPF